LRDYTRELMREAHEKGSPVMRTLFYVFPDDKQCWEIEEQYMYGNKYLVAPVLESGKSSSKVYLPEGSQWKDYWSDKVWDGGQTVESEISLERMPILMRC
jgi:alpha-D-xyloside xylohydrolase